ncbi:hypothetical protein CSUB01_10979 [Colletotrichum sublineola]|uniref:Uncharacterized protein n=1 Tax=Colletotrichum sublineola TaxID=1173701 RepID=A0A066WSH3_COLSU|nr:hypothetical protein CSUB01_10979 [Colletotrichum sublineola]
MRYGAALLAKRGDAPILPHAHRLGPAFPSLATPASQAALHTTFAAGTDTAPPPLPSTFYNGGYGRGHFGAPAGFSSAVFLTASAHLTSKPRFGRGGLIAFG